MRITTWNVNGMRAALRKGFGDCLAQLAPDVLLLQEIRCRPEQLPAEWAAPAGWHVHWRPARKPGHAGTAIWSRFPLEVVSVGLADRGGDSDRGDPEQDDPDGRVIVARVAGVTVVSVYLPSGSSGPERQAYKDLWLERFLPWAARLAARREPVVLGGDLNIAHTERDIYYAAGNQNNSGFLPHERAWFGRLLQSGWTDFVRQQFGDVDGPYSWWSNRGQARRLDRGWRIDYLLGNRAAAARWRDASISRHGGLLVSDHAPVTINLQEKRIGSHFRP